MLSFRYRYTDWRLLFATAKDGVSMQTFYNRTEEEGPTFIIVETTNGEVLVTLLTVLAHVSQIFGAFCSESWTKRSGFYGTGETFLFTLSPSAKKFSWSNNDKTEYFMYSTDHELAVGGGGYAASLMEDVSQRVSGKFGLWIGHDFQSGVTDRCTTYENEVLASSDRFNIEYFEVWGFVGFADY